MAFIQLSGLRSSFGPAISSAMRRSICRTVPRGAGRPQRRRQNHPHEIAAGSSNRMPGKSSPTKGARVVYLPQTGIRFEKGRVHDIAEEAFPITGMLDEQKR